MSKNVIIVGAGPGLSTSLATKFSQLGKQVIVAARNTDKLAELCTTTGATAIQCDSTEGTQVAELFRKSDELGTTETVIYNPSYRMRGSIAELRPEDVQKSLQVNAYGAFLVAQQAAQRMLKSGGGNVLFTGASASTKGFPMSATFAMGKFALRGLAQSMAREFAPKNIHVAHIVIDGGIRSEQSATVADQSDNMLDPNAIADTYVMLSQQQRSAWTWEIELRPWDEKF
ncbi:MAG: NAD(P)-dependent dehydrogenase (short-subunit alcohol dehydrogenase family) [Parasphingorhabdus sp.]|jgi:NAD(P)-dependent dehydrogenase (short-subunit alcohol dehydrogenase family)